VREALHSIIASRAEARIRSRAWAPGTRLPPERELCDLLDVSRTTLRKALAELEERGLITRHQGRGTFVTRPRVDADASTFFSIGAAMRARGVILATRVLSANAVAANDRLAAELNCQSDAALLKLERLRFAGGDPLVLEVSYLPLDLFPGLDRADFASRSLYDVLREDYGRFVATASETLEPVILTRHEASLLGVSGGSPALLIRRSTRDRTDVVVEVGEALLRGDRSRFLIERRVREGWPAEARPSGMPSSDAGTASTARIVASLLDDAVNA
jgi:GntR family transcriptional regulator